MNCVVCLAAIGIVMIASSALADDGDMEIELVVGEQRVVPSLGVSSYSEGVPGVVDVRLAKDATSFVMVGQRPGSSSLLLLMSDGGQRLYKIQVRAADGPSADDPDRIRAVRARDNVRLDFYFVQVSKAYRDRVGLGWPGSIGGSMSASFDLTSASLTDASAFVSDQALPRLDMAEAQGWAKLLRQAAFVTANGTEAKWTGGGEVNVPVTGGLSSSIKAISFGTQVQVLPRYDRDSGRMELTIHADVSDLSNDQGTGVPGRITSTLDSVVNVELGQSVVLAGLRSQSSSHDTAGLPLLSRIPILGALFGSSSEHSQEVENLVFIVPSVVDAVTLGARAQIIEALRDFETYPGDMDETQLVAPLLKAHPTRGQTTTPKGERSGM